MICDICGESIRDTVYTIESSEYRGQFWGSPAYETMVYRVCGECADYGYVIDEESLEDEEDEDLEDEEM